MLGAGSVSEDYNQLAIVDVLERHSPSYILDTDLQLVGLWLKTSADLARLCDLTRGENGHAQWQELTTDICVAAEAV